MLRSLAAVLLLLTAAAPAVAEPIPYGETVKPRSNWRERAAENLVGPLPVDDGSAP